MAHNRYVVVTLTATDQPDSVGESRVIPLDTKTSSIDVGRASKAEGKELEPAVNNALFSSRVISRRHAVLWADMVVMQLFLKDLGSMHGTYVGDSHLAKHVVLALKNGDILKFGADVTRGPDTFHALEMRVTFEWKETQPPSESAGASSLPNSSSGGRLPTFSVPADSDSDDDPLGDMGFETARNSFIEETTRGPLSSNRHITQSSSFSFPESDDSSAKSLLDEKPNGEHKGTEHTPPSSTEKLLKSTYDLINTPLKTGNYSQDRSCPYKLPQGPTGLTEEEKREDERTFRAMGLRGQEKVIVVLDGEEDGTKMHPIPVEYNTIRMHEESHKVPCDETETDSSVALEPDSVEGGTGGPGIEISEASDGESSDVYAEPVDSVVYEGTPDVEDFGSEPKGETDGYPSDADAESIESCLKENRSVLDPSPDPFDSGSTLLDAAATASDSDVNDEQEAPDAHIPDSPPSSPDIMGTAASRSLELPTPPRLAPNPPSAFSPSPMLTGTFDHQPYHFAVRAPSPSDAAMAKPTCQQSNTALTTSELLRRTPAAMMGYPTWPTSSFVNCSATFPMQSSWTPPSQPYREGPFSLAPARTTSLFQDIHSDSSQGYRDPTTVLNRSTVPYGEFARTPTYRGYDLKDPLPDVKDAFEGGLNMSTTGINTRSAEGRAAPLDEAAEFENPFYPPTEPFIATENSVQKTSSNRPVAKVSIDDIVEKQPPTNKLKRKADVMSQSSSHVENESGSMDRATTDLSGSQHTQVTEALLDRTGAELAGQKPVDVKDSVAQSIPGGPSQPGSNKATENVVEPPVKRARTSAAKSDPRLAKYAAAAIGGAIAGGIGAIAALIALPPNYFA